MPLPFWAQLLQLAGDYRFFNAQTSSIHRRKRFSRNCYQERWELEMIFLSSFFGKVKSFAAKRRCIHCGVKSIGLRACF